MSVSTLLGLGGDMTESEYRSYITPISGRPTRESISEAVGFRVPSNFAKFIGQIYDFGEGEPRQCADLLSDILGVYPGGITCRYAGTPPELFPIGTTGCDGDHYGFLVLAPELKLDELPLVHYCPMDSDGVVLVGQTTEQGTAHQMATFLNYEFIKDDRKTLIRDFADDCGIGPLQAINANPVIPDNWKHLSSSDGVGSLGPAVWFSDDPIFDISKWTKPEEYVWAADVFTKKGHFGSALHYLREGLWGYCWEGNRMIGEKTCELYRLMGREPLAEALDWTMANRWTSRANED
jgi:hypothetical protein